MPATAHSKIAVVGIDIGKNSFHIVGLDRRGAIVLRQKWSHGQVDLQLKNNTKVPGKPQQEARRSDSRDASAYGFARYGHPKLRAAGLTDIELGNHNSHYPQIRSRICCSCRMR